MDTNKTMTLFKEQHCVDKKLSGMDTHVLRDFRKKYLIQVDKKLSERDTVHKAGVVSLWNRWTKNSVEGILWVDQERGGINTEEK